MKYLSDSLVNFSKVNLLIFQRDLIKSAKNIEYINDPTILQYGDIKGYFDFREDLSKFLETNYNNTVDPNDILITNGVTGSLALLCSIFSDNNTVVFVEEPTYFLAINIFKDFKLDIVSIPIKEDGIDIEFLEKKLYDYRSKNKILYTIPSFHNPTGYTMSEEKRIKLGKLSDDKHL